MKFRLITGADAKSFEDAANAYLAELAPQPGLAIQLFQPFVNDHFADRLCMAVMVRDMAAEQQAAREREQLFALKRDPAAENGVTGEGIGQNATDETGDEGLAPPTGNDPPPADIGDAPAAAGAASEAPPT